MTDSTTQTPSSIPSDSVHISLSPITHLLPSSSPNKISVLLGPTNITALVDTGAAVSCMSKSFYETSGLQNECLLSTPTFSSITGVTNTPLTIVGEATIPVFIGDFQTSHRFSIIADISQDVILGMDFLKSHNATIDLQNNALSLSLPDTTVSSSSPESYSYPVYTAQSVQLPANSKTIFNIAVDCSESSLTGTFFPDCDNPSLAMPHCLLSVSDARAVCETVNTADTDVILHAGEYIGSFVDSRFLDDCLFIPFDDHISPAPVLSSETATSSPSQPLSQRAQYIQRATDLGISVGDADLTTDQRDELLALIGEHNDCFATSVADLGDTKFYDFKIDTGDAKPIRKAAYRYSPPVLQQISEQIQQMLDHDIIEPSTSEWLSPVVMVKKRGTNKLRFCVDFRNLNKVTRPLSFAMPRLDDVIDALSGSTIYSVTDMRQGFWQLGVHEDSRDKTSFTCHEGVFRFKRLPFGLRNSPAHYQTKVSQILGKMAFKHAICYIDDILIHSKSFDDHMSHLRQLFTKFRDAGLKFHPEKCVFGKTQVQYLGYTFSQDGVHLDPSATQNVRNFPTPKTSKDIRVFLGLAQYYRRFVKNFSKIAAPLTRLLGKDIRFEWTDDCQIAFDTLKAALTSPPILAYPNFEKPFLISCDASKFGLGYILGQKDDSGHERVIAYGGRTLSNAERKYTVTEQELLAVISAIKEFRHYLTNPFVLYTDHIALKWLKTNSDLNGRLSRWALLLQQYDFEVIHRKGTHNTNADALSRNPLYERESSHDSPAHEEPDDSILTEVLPLPSPTHPSSSSVSVIPVQADNTHRLMTDLDLLKMFQTDSVSRSQLADYQLNDPAYHTIIQYLTQNLLPDDDKQARKTILEAEHYAIDNGILFHLHMPRMKQTNPKPIVKRLAVPHVLTDAILRSYHDSILAGHFGFDRTYSAISQKYFWPRCYSDVQAYVQTCLACQQAKRQFHAKKAPLQNLPACDIMERCHIDILGPIKTLHRERYTYILVCVDALSHWCEAIPLVDTTAETITKAFYQHWIARFGPPKSLVTDRGANFLSKTVQDLCATFGIQKHTTSSYNPKANSSAERPNQVIMQCIRAYCTQGKHWPDLLPSIMYAYNTNKSASLRCSPFMLLFGREPTQPIDNMLLQSDTTQSSLPARLHFIHNDLRLLRDVAKFNLAEAQTKSKARYDKVTKDPSFQIGDKVWLQIAHVPTGLSAKLVNKYDGPFYISSICPNGHTYRLRRCSTDKLLKAPVHSNRLRRYKCPKQRRTNPLPPVTPSSPHTYDASDLPTQSILDMDNSSPQPPANSESAIQIASQPNDDVYIVEKLLACKTIRGIRHYKVKWQGFRDTTWEPLEHIPGQLRRIFHATRTNAGRKRKHKPKNH